MLISPPPRTGSGAVEAAYAMLDSLVALGLRHLVLAPGSRSAPLVYAATMLIEARKNEGESPLELHVRHDERAAAFTALGLSRAGELAGVGTTSGTASAHLLAAAMEAHHSHVPLILVTADRPAELRGTGANQTTNQVGMFEPFAALSVDVPAPTAERASDAELRLAVNTASRVVAAATGTPGPVHVNLGFRDPLTPQGPHTEAASGAPLALTTIDTAKHTPTPLTLDPTCVIVAGDGYESGRRAEALATALGLPLLAEPSSNARGNQSVLVPAYPRAISDIMAGPQHPLRPTQAIVFGHPTLSRPVMREILGAADIDIIVESPHLNWPDPTRRASRVVPLVDPENSRIEGEAPGFLDGWIAAGTTHLEHALSTLQPQAKAALAVWDQCSKDGTALVLGASSLIRDLEVLAGASSARVYANRGLAGIDGTVSMASGIALAGESRVAGEASETNLPRARVLLGDVTAIHDLTGLVIGPLEREPHLQIVVVDDGGGRIFGGLEHASAPRAVLERFFTTPHGVDIAGIIRACGIPVKAVTPDSLGQELSFPSQKEGRSAYFLEIHS